MRRRVVSLLVSVWLIFASGGLRAKAERLPIKIYSSADGLGSGFVDFLIGDSRGFMWFCTRDGLSRFDGARFINYRVGDQNSPPGIERITETRGGVYWITTSGGLYRFTANSLSQPTRSTGERPFLNAQFVRYLRGSVFEVHNGTIWYYGGDLYRLVEQGGKFDLENANLGIPTKPNNPLGIFQMREAPDGSLWLSTNQGLVRRMADGRLILYRHETDLRQSLVGMTIDRGGRIWLVWREDFFVFKPPELESLTNLPTLSVQPFTPNRVASITPDREFQLPEKPGEIIRVVQTTPFSQTRASQRLFR